MLALGSRCGVARWGIFIAAYSEYAKFCACSGVGFEAPCLVNLKGLGFRGSVETSKESLMDADPFSQAPPFSQQTPTLRKINGTYFTHSHMSDIFNVGGWGCLTLGVGGRD